MGANSFNNPQLCAGMGLLSEISVSNVFIYVGDAIRWDSTPRRIKDQGLSAKTIASSIHTPTSFTSMISGLHPPQHGCWDFSYRLGNDTTTILNLQGYSTAFANSVNEVFRTDPEMEFVLNNVMNSSVSSYEKIGDIEPPFIFLERGPGGHSPYGNYDGNSWEYYRERGAASTMRYVNEYRKAVDIDADHFESQVEKLDERGLLEDTLVIYTSDHGELLGEGGCLGHNEPIHPKHVYVPTVFVYPDIGTGSLNGVFRHIDLLPTIAGTLAEDISGHPGRNLVEESPATRGASYYTRKVATNIPLISGKLEYQSVWGGNGGYVYPKNGRINRSVILLGKLLKGAKREYLRRHLPAVSLHYLTGDTVYGVPNFTNEAAKADLREIQNLPKSRGVQQGLNEGQRDHLRNLGYLE